MDNKDKNNVGFANHSKEFHRFFDARKLLCDEISGLKPVTLNNKEVFITKLTFGMGIKRLNGFVRDFINYVEDPKDIDNINKNWIELKNDFDSDSKYHELVKQYLNVEMRDVKTRRDLYIERLRTLSTEQHIKLDRSYTNYLTRCFQIADILTYHLQPTISISSQEIAKKLDYVENGSFYDNLAKHKEEIKDSIALLGLTNVMDCFKKMLGFYYTYRYLYIDELQNINKDLLKSCFSLICYEEFYDDMLNVQKGNSVNDDRMIRTVINDVRETLNTIFFVCNEGFINKNILPQSKNDVLGDGTLI